MKFKISEIFYSLQGEGRFIGVPSVFMRTFGCNFKCEGFGCPSGAKSVERDHVHELIQANPDKYTKFEELPLVSTGCDSYASWDPRFKQFSPTMTNDELVDRFKVLLPAADWKSFNGNYAHLVITGGEPLLGWQKNYAELFAHPGMQNLADITFETNGTQELDEDFYNAISDWHTDFEFTESNMGKWREVTFSVSPKLSVSGEKWEEAIKPEIIAQYQEVGVTYLKFVVETLADFQEVDQAVAEYRAAGFMGNVYVMPVGGTLEGYQPNTVRVAEEALKRGYFYSPRLHVDLWGNGWGK